MNTERRRGVEAVPLNYEVLLNEDQCFSLRKIEESGWELLFIRRDNPEFETAIPVVRNARRDKIGIVEPGGMVNMNTDVQVRDR